MLVVLSLIVAIERNEIDLTDSRINDGGIDDSSLEEEKFKVFSKFQSDVTLEKKSTEFVDEIKHAGYSDLNKNKSIHRESTTRINKKELLSHVPQEMTVMKYGYVDNRVLGTLENILDTGGYLSSKTLNAISIVAMNLEEDGKDINIHYRIKRTGGSPVLGGILGNTSVDDFSVLGIFGY